MKTTSIAFLAGSTILISTGSGLAQTTTTASDSASNYSSWGSTAASASQASSGFGFGGWAFNNSTPNGGYAGTYLDTSGASSLGQNAFAFYANSGSAAEAQATLSFDAGLSANQTFSIQMQNNNIGDQGGQVGFNLQNSSGVNLFQFYFNGGQNDYYINVGGTQVDTGVGYSASPLTLSFEQGVGNAWSFSIDSTVLSSTGTGDLLSGTGISQANLFNLNGADSGNQNGNLYFNNPTITTTATPEPSTLALCALSGLATMFLVRRRH